MENLLNQILKICDTYFKNGLASIVNMFLICILLYVLSLFLTKLIRKYFSDNSLLILRIKNIILTSFAVYSCLLEIRAFEDLAKTVLASSGVLAVVIGFAAQETLAEFVSGILIMVFKPFQIGDIIKMNDGTITGTVKDISLRHTIIQTLENTNLIIPNSSINKAILENISRTGESCKANFLKIGISYDSDLEKAMKIIEEEILKHPDYTDGRTKEQIENKVPEVITRLVNFGDSSIDLKTTVYSKDHSTGVAMLSDLRISIKKRFDAEGIEIPYPNRTITIKKDES